MEQILSYLLTAFIFITVFSILVLIHEWGHFFSARKLGVGVLEFSLGFGKKIWTHKAKDGVLYCIRLFPLGGFVRMQGEDSATKKKGDFVAASLWRRMIITLAGIVMNLIFTIALFAAVFMNGTAPFMLSKADVLQAEKDGYVEITRDENDAFQGLKVIKEVKHSFLPAIQESFGQTLKISGLFFQKIAEIPIQLFKKGEVSKDLSGPVGIVKMTHQIIPQGIWAILKFAALLSLSLALFNLLPIPALDGGRFLFQIIEMILTPFGAKIPAKLEEYIHITGFVLLMALFLLITGKDLGIGELFARWFH